MSAGAFKLFLRRIAPGSIGVAVLTSIAFSTHLNIESAISLYLVVVVLQSLSGDFLTSLSVGALSAACLDFFFTEPIFSLYINDKRNILALIAFTFTALVITRLVSQARRQAIASRLQRERLDRLYNLSQELLHLDPEAAGGKLLEPFRRQFEVTAMCIFDGIATDLRMLGEPRNPGLNLADKTREAFIRSVDLDEKDSQLSVRCIRVAGRITGAIGFQDLRDSAETAGPLTALTATFLERTNAFRKASAAAAAEQAEVFRSAILDALAHEFKTPLATILAAAGGLREAGPLEAAQLEMAETVETEAARLGSLTSRLLRMARLEKKDIQPRMELTDLTSLVKRIARQYTDRSPDRRITTLPDESIEVMADAELLRLAISQLVENACKYSDPGSTVAIEIQPQGDFVGISVSNQGSSIPVNEQHRVFERFYRGADAKRSTSGSGLGLYVARKIALAHGGTLNLASSSGADGGVTFSLTLPRTKWEAQTELTSELPDEVPDGVMPDGVMNDERNHSSARRIATAK